MQSRRFLDHHPRVGQSAKVGNARGLFAQGRCEFGAEPLLDPSVRGGLLAMPEGREKGLTCSTLNWTIVTGGPWRALVGPRDARRYRSLP
jgi:hypothetical protein